MSNRAAELEESITRYAAGPGQLESAVAGLTAAEVQTQIAPGKWSILEVVCHIADFELVYADRMKRILAEERPTMFGGDPDQFAAHLAYGQRDLHEELRVIAAVRQQVTRILKTLDSSAFERVGIHSTDGPLSLATLLNRITGHIPHHTEFIRQKRQGLGRA